MNSTKKHPFLLIGALILFTGALTHLDRVSFKKSKSFCPRFLMTCRPPNSKWDLPHPSNEELKQLDPILNQKFYYIAKGAHCFAFISEDQKYVIKFHKYASHLRLYPWLTHPFSYQFNEKRGRIKQHNIEQLDYNLLSYKESFEHLKEESGLLLVHINKTDYLKKELTLIDNAQIAHKIPLDQVTFIIQQKADLLYPTLDHYYESENFTKAKEVISQVIRLIASSAQKGYSDQDPILRKNYGLLADRAIHIDIGDLVRDDKVKERSVRIAYVKELTASLRKRLESTYPKLLDYYDQEIRALSQ